MTVANSLAPTAPGYKIVSSVDLISFLEPSIWFHFALVHARILILHAPVLYFE